MEKRFPTFLNKKGEHAARCGASPKQMRGTTESSARTKCISEPLKRFGTQNNRRCPAALLPSRIIYSWSREFFVYWFYNHFNCTRRERGGVSLQKKILHELDSMALYKAVCVYVCVLLFVVRLVAARKTD